MAWHRNTVTLAYGGLSGGFLKKKKNNTATKQSQADGITNFYLCLVAELLTRGQKLCVQVKKMRGASQNLAKEQRHRTSHILLVAVQTDALSLESDLELAIELHSSLNPTAQCFRK